MVRLMLAESFFINRVAIVIEHNCDGRSWRCKWVPLFQLPSNEINKFLRRPSINFSQSRTFLERASVISWKDLQPLVQNPRIGVRERR